MENATILNKTKNVEYIILKEWWFDLDFSNALVILGCLFVFWIVGKIFSVPIKAIFKLIINSILGGFLIFIINTIGAAWNFHIGLNIITSVIVGILGVPGAILLVILKMFIWL